jgi:mRNA-degrading endonuclease RelE of RelBE toxin-antitoxin system
MEFRIADTFTDSLAKLTGDEQKSVKTAAFDLQLNPAHPSLQFRKLDKPKDRRFWSIRVNSDVRLIVHRTESSLLLCYVGHHDNAYHWAERRKLETHPKTGAAQFVEVRETVQEITVPKYVEVVQPAVASVAPPKPPLFVGMSEDELLGYGVPAEWLADVHRANEDTLLELADHLPSEAAEALLDLATGVAPKVARPVTVGGDPFQHPDAQRRFRVMNNQEELERALDYPWDKWTIFLHPAQRTLVERDYSGPARVAGSAGTGKTIVALHRAVFLVRANPDTRVLLTTFSDTLANALRTKLRRLISNEPRLGERLEVHSMNAIGRRLHEVNLGRPQIASREAIRELLKEAVGAVEGNKFSLQFLLTEWEQVVDAWQLESWESYRDVMRLGRKTRLQEAQRGVLWSIFERVRSALKARGLVTYSDVFSRVAFKLREIAHPLFEFAVVDEAQDISVPQLRFLAALGAGRPNSLFFAGDLGQRIFQQPFSWKALGVEVRGRSSTLPGVNYLLPFRQQELQRELVPFYRSDCFFFVRSPAELDRARSAVEDAKLSYKVLNDNVETTSGRASISTMHLAKGLEFRTVVVMACDDEVIPLQERIETVSDDADLEEVYNTERHLLYVACTRARDHLLVTSVKPASEFLDDLRK